MSQSKKYLALRDKILSNQNSIWLPKKTRFKSCVTHSWFDLQVSTSRHGYCDASKIQFPTQPTEKLLKAKKINVLFSKKQRQIMLHWMKSYVVMYNIAIKKIKKNYTLAKELGTVEAMDDVAKFYDVRKSVKYSKDLLKKGLLPKKFFKNVFKPVKKTQKQPEEKSNDPLKNIPVHSLDGAVKLACANYESASSNFKAGHIKNFRMRYWKQNKDHLLFDIEKTSFRATTFFPSIFSSIKCEYDGKAVNLDTIQCDSKLMYDGRTNKFLLLVPEEAKIDSIIQPNEIVSIDPGERTWMTCLSENKVIEIGTNCYDKFFPLLKRLKRMKGKHTEKAKHIMRQARRKISDAVEDLHWKTANYLTKNFKRILIGDLSAKGICSRSSTLPPILKRLAYALSFSTFRTRLQFKCKVNNCSYLKVKEAYTSKTCSACGFFHENLGGNKIFHCPGCKITLDRDINACRGIYCTSC